MAKLQIDFEVVEEAEEAEEAYEFSNFSEEVEEISNFAAEVGEFSSYTKDEELENSVEEAEEVSNFEPDLGVISHFAEQKRMIDELRSKCSGSWMSELEDHIFWVFVTACNGDMVKAKGLLEKCMEAHFALTNVHITSFKDYIPLEEVVRNAKYEFLGNDLLGRPVIWCMVGSWNPKELIEKGLKEELFLSIFKLADDLLRQAYEQSILGGKRINGILIVDLKGLSFKRFFHLETFRLALKYVRDLEPLTSLIGKIYIINCSSLFLFIRNVLKPILRRESLAKVDILSTNEKKWKECLRKNIPMNIIPFEYGGTGAKVLS